MKGSRFVFWNINCDRRMKHPRLQKALPQCLMSERLPLILNVLEDEDEYLGNNRDYVYVCLCEVDKEAKIKIIDWANARGYYLVSAPYNLSELSFHLMIITNNPFGFSMYKHFPLTKSGKYVPSDIDRTDLNETLGEPYEKTLLTAYLHDGTILGVTHLGLGNKAKKKQADKIGEIFRTIFKDRQIVLGGDFNCFDMEVKEPTFLKGCLDGLVPLKDVTDHIPSTFDCSYFPYDFYFLMSDDEKKTYTKFLEDTSDEIGIFSAWLKDITAKYAFKGIALDRIFIQHADHSFVKERPFYAYSDHMFLELRLE